MEKIDFPVIDRIVVYHANEVDRNFLIPRYAALCEREEPLTLPEGMSLGMETTLMIARAREYARAHPTASGARSPTVSNIHGNELHHIVRELFGITPPEQGEDEDSALPANTPGALVSPSRIGNLSQADPCPPAAPVAADPSAQEHPNAHINGTNAHANGTANGHAQSTQSTSEENGAAEGTGGQKGQNGHDAIAIKIQTGAASTGEAEETGPFENGHTADPEPNTPNRGGAAGRGRRGGRR